MYISSIQSIRRKRLVVTHNDLRALSTLRGLRGAPEVPPLCQETPSLGQQMLKEPLGINGLTTEKKIIIEAHYYLYFIEKQNSQRKKSSQKVTKKFIFASCKIKRNTTVFKNFLLFRKKTNSGWFQKKRIVMNTVIFRGIGSGTKTPFSMCSMKHVIF